MSFFFNAERDLKVLTFHEAGLGAKPRTRVLGNVTANTSCEARATKFRTHPTTSLGAVLNRNRKNLLLTSTFVLDILLPNTEQTTLLDDS